MKVTIDNAHQTVEVIENLEPQGAFYQITQGDNVISINDDYTMRELIETLKFIWKRTGYHDETF